MVLSQHINEILTRDNNSENKTIHDNKQYIYEVCKYIYYIPYVDV